MEKIASVSPNELHFPTLFSKRDEASEAALEKHRRRHRLAARYPYGLRAVHVLFDGKSLNWNEPNESTHISSVFKFRAYYSEADRVRYIVA
jgi:hypothetical protein